MVSVSDPEEETEPAETGGKGGPPWWRRVDGT